MITFPGKGIESPDPNWPLNWPFADSKTALKSAWEALSLGALHSAVYDVQAPKNAGNTSLALLKLAQRFPELR